MNYQITLHKDGAPVTLEDHPSLLALVHAQSRMVEGLREQIKEQSVLLASLKERKELYKQIGTRTQGVANKISRTSRRKRELTAQLAAAESGYIEVPDMGGREVRTHESDDETWWTETLPADVPMDVVRALAHAQEQGVFDSFRIYRPASEGTDPMIVGIAGGATFYVGSWR